MQAPPPVHRIVDGHHRRRAWSTLGSLRLHEATPLTPRAGTRARGRHLTAVIHHGMPPVHHRTASPPLHNRIRINGSRLPSSSLQDLITIGGSCVPHSHSPPLLVSDGIFLADSTHVSGNLRTHHPYLKSETARPALTTLITPFRMRQARSVTALLRAKHCHCLTLVTAPCPTRRCSCISSRSSLSAFRATFPSSNTTMSPAACSMAHCHHSWPIA